MSSISSLGSGISFTGLASNVDTDKLVEGLLAVQKSRVQSLKTQQDRFSLQQTTFKTLESQVLDLQTQAFRLARTANGAFDGRKATVSEESLVAATASSSAAAGTYTFKVNKLAKAHQIASAGVADASTLFQTGNLKLKVGEGATTTIAITSSNNTLQGIADAINRSGGDVSASVINDGSGSPHRLLLTAKKTGLINDIEVDASGLGGAGATLNLNPATQTIQAGEDAQVVLGSGATALTVNSASNKLDTLIGGVTLDLKAADSNKTITLTVSNDTASAKKAIEELVNSFNKVIDFIDERDSYDDQTKQAGTLLGSSAAADIQDQLARTIGGVVGGVNKLANRLSAIGITFTDKGRLQIDSGKLDQALNGQLTGVSLTDVRSMFALSGSSTNTNVSFVLGTNKTKATTAPIQVNITSVAKQASLTAANDVVAPVTINAGNKDFTVSINGRTASLQLTEGVYNTAGDLAQELQSKLTASTDLVGAQVSVTVEGSKLKITTGNYGSSAVVTMTSGSALGSLGFTAGQTASGQNVAGTLDGVAATGAGQLLTGATGTAAEGLQLKVTLTEAQLNPGGSEAQVSVTRGLAAELDTTISRFVDSANGRFKTIDKGFQDSIDDIKAAIDRQNEFMEAKRETLIRRFAAMEAAVGKLKGLGDTLSAQLAGLSNLRG